MIKYVIFDVAEKAFIVNHLRETFTKDLDKASHFDEKEAYTNCLHHNYEEKTISRLMLPLPNDLEKPDLIAEEAEYLFCFIVTNLETGERGFCRMDDPKNGFSQYLLFPNIKKLREFMPDIFGGLEQWEQDGFKLKLELFRYKKIEKMDTFFTAPGEKQ